MTSMVIAPCGMNCALCRVYLRGKNSCQGCLGDLAFMPRYCATCKIRNCTEFASGEKHFCFECSLRFPCRRLRDLDKRYRGRYHMSMLENLETIRLQGLEHFVAQQRERWKCPGCGELLSVHSKTCLHCGRLVEHPNSLG